MKEGMLKRKNERVCVRKDRERMRERERGMIVRDAIEKRRD